MLSKSLLWLKQAQTEGYAIGAFNANTLEQMQAIVIAAQTECAPVIIQISHRALMYIGNGSSVLGLRYAAAMGRIAAESVSVPVVLHLDHANDVEILQAASLGFTSAMFDGGNLPLDERIARTRELCETLHAVGMIVEAEVGEVGRMNEGRLTTENELTDPEQAAEFVNRTNCDALAISTGSIHAVRHKEITLDLERLSQIRALVEVPLVLHGASGVTDASIKHGILQGLCKVNIATQMNQTFSNAIRKYLSEKPNEVDPRKFLIPARERMQLHVQERMRFLGVSQRANQLNF